MPRLRRLWIRAFRNYSRADIALDDGITALVGRNGAGKSNLLEAVYLVATGRSYRTAREEEAILRGETAARVRAQISRRGREEEIEITLAVEDGRLTSQMRVNGAPTPRGSVLGRLTVVLAAPWDLEMVRGSAAGRRRLLDAALAQLSPSYFFALHRYHRVVAQRNAHMRRGAPGGTEAWDAQMVALGVRIAAHRTEYMRRVAPEAEAWFSRLGGEGTLAVAYRPSWPGETDESREEEARAQLARLRADEIKRGTTLSGPHRDDVDLSLEGAALRANGSQGQWRTAMLAVRLAERGVMASETGESPVLLLDDAIAELDGDRQKRVLGLADEAQVLLTSTGLPQVAGPVRVLAVEAGAVAEAIWSSRLERF
ncbi:MAG: DNA replication/repair protein RecF [bacterium]|nr:DNA replication/repair protein RecF [bacterium]